MVVTIKLNKGTIEKLIQFKELTPVQSKNLSLEDLTLEVNDSNLLIELHKNENMLEISDSNGTFGIWFKITHEKFEKLKEIIKDMGP